MLKEKIQSSRNPLGYRQILILQLKSIYPLKKLQKSNLSELIKLKQSLTEKFEHIRLAEANKAPVMSPKDEPNFYQE